MKITCDACGSKYTIADDKVRGRKVKVRCKNCKANILVDGSALGEAGSGGDTGDTETSESDRPAAGNLWTVNLTDEDSRDMTSEEIVQGWQSGLVKEDAYVWRDGMSAWKPILEVAELKVKLLAGGNLSPAPAAASAGPALLSAGPVLPVSSAPAQVGLQSAPFGGVAKATPAPPASSDLFGSWGAETPFGAGDDGGKKPTGARNENSVLFSLDALKGTADKPNASPKKGITSGDDLFSMGTMPGGGLLTANIDLLTAPAAELPPAPASRRGTEAVSPKRGNGLLLGVIAVALVAVGGGYFAFKDKLGDAGEQASEAEEKAREAQAKASEAEVKVREAEAAQKKLEEALAKARAEATAKGEDPSAAEKKLKEAQAPSEPTSAAATPAPSQPTKEASSSPAKEKTSAAPAAPATSSGSGKAFDVGAAKAALSAAAANAGSCGTPGGPKGAGKVQITFATSGRVTTANVVEGPFGGTSVGGCVSSTFKRARVPGFDGSPQTVTKSFKIN